MNQKEWKQKSPARDIGEGEGGGLDNNFRTLSIFVFFLSDVELPFLISWITQVWGAEIPWRGADGPPAGGNGGLPVRPANQLQLCLRARWAAGRALPGGTWEARVAAGSPVDAQRSAEVQTSRHCFEYLGVLSLFEILVSVIERTHFLEKFWTEDLENKRSRKWNGCR